MSDCSACIRAETHIHSGLYQAGCLPCEARAIANGPEAHARDANPAPLQSVMRRVWPEVDKYKRGRALVWAWIKRNGGLL